MAHKLSVLIPSYNSENYIRGALESTKWADEVIVYDSDSRDKTLDIVREYGAKVIQHEYHNSADEKNWAIKKCSHEWVLIVDTDEVLEAGLQKEIQEKLRQEEIPENGFRIPRKNFIYRKWVRQGGIYPDYQLRLFRRETGRYETRFVHAHLLIQGGVGVLKQHLLHEGFKNMAVWINKLERYSNYEAEELTRQGKKFQLRRVTLYPLLVFVRNYFIRLGFLEGPRGLMLAGLDAIYYFMMYAKLYEWENIGKSG